MKCLMCGRPLDATIAVRPAIPMWILWTNILVLPTIGMALALSLFEVIGAWSIIVGFSVMVAGIVFLRGKSIK